MSRPRAWWFRRRTQPAEGREAVAATFPTRLETAEHGLYFDAVFHYGHRLTGVGTCVHPDAVARTLVRDVAAPIARRFPVALVAEAESAINAGLSGEVTSDRRLICTAKARLTSTTETRSLAEHRARVVEPVLAEDAARAIRLQLLRDCVLDQGPLYWLDLEIAAGHLPDLSAERINALLEAHRVLGTALQAGRIRNMADETSRLRARFEDLLVTLQDPVLGERLLTLLESLRAVLHPSAPTSEGTHHDRMP